MRGKALALLISESLGHLEASRDELRDLDAAIGDGDLGITVGDGAAAVRQRLAELETPITPAAVLAQTAGSFSSANPSTFAALVGIALLAGARALGHLDDVDHCGALLMVDAALESLQDEGGARVGDKTIIDALSPSRDALARAAGDSRDTLGAMIAAAQRGVLDTRELAGRKGRSAWVGKRGIGHPDGGATAYLRLLEALREAWPALPNGS